MSDVDFARGVKAGWNHGYARGRADGWNELAEIVPQPVTELEQPSDQILRSAECIRSESLENEDK